MRIISEVLSDKLLLLPFLELEPQSADTDPQRTGAFLPMALIVLESGDDRLALDILQLDAPVANDCRQKTLVWFHLHHSIGQRCALSL